MRVLVAVLALSLGTSLVVVADDEVALRRTTPRASLVRSEDTIVIGIPAGRAWGVESALRPLGSATRLAVRVNVADAVVREAFVRVAYYATAAARSRQLAVTDSAPVRAGEHALVVVDLDPPPGAVAFRVRLLARLVEAAERSANDAITARSPWLQAVDSRFSRLLP